MYPNMFPGFRPQMGIYPQPMQPIPPMVPTPQPVQQVPQTMTITPVTGMAPVEAAQAPFDGTALFFFDTAANAVYVKQFDASNGTAPVTIYRPVPQAAPPQYATVEMVNALAERLDAITTQKAPRRKEADAE